jgi:hypothetical protein
VRRFAVIALLLAVLAAPAEAQLIRRAPAKAPLPAPPPGTPAAEAEIWPFPLPDPKTWWDDERPAPPEASDPLGGRRLGRGDRRPAINNGIDPATYRLWGLMPLQWQALRGGEMVLEVWVRPSLSVRQSVMRVTLRADGKAFVQARAGLACCEADIARRVGFDAELAAGQAAPFLALRNNALWAAPRDVEVYEPGMVTGSCVNGASYDLTLMTAERTASVRRACDPAAIGQAADALDPVFRAALGHEPRFDVIHAGATDFAAARKTYQDLVAHGGALRPDPQAKARPAEPTPPGTEAPPGAPAPSPR